ncbi:MAG TPA: M23 family metallopeptidase [Symbiobacteriaceae bacterium]|nr:M23 family metallopeptidase [Symbiobacteriaceae bacterium]
MKRLLALGLALFLTGCSIGGAKPAPPPPTAAPTPAPPPAPEPKPFVPAPPKAPVITLEPPQVQQGDIGVIRFDLPVEGEVSIKVQGLSEQPRVFRLEGRPIAFVGIPANARVGSYPVTVTWPDGKYEGALEVVYKKFTEDRLTVTEEQESTYYDPRQADEWARIFALRSKSWPNPLWDGPFRAPLSGALAISTYFGQIRFVNGTETGRHSGMDFEADEGTAVLAPAPGRVLMTEKMIVSGHTIILDHGLNLYTTYYHLSAYDVKPGDWVEPGQVIGRVGNTGFSLGPHLHWTATIGNTPVDPWPLTLASPLGVRRAGPVAEE